MPQGAAVPQTQLQAPNYAAGAQLGAQSQLAQQQGQQAMYQQLLGGLFGLGGGLGAAGILASSRKYKRNIQRIGMHGRFPLYAFEYTYGGGPQIGVMLQDVQAIEPAAVLNGIEFVDYGKLN
jgi:hypothetical protein